jgi:hypothetical protein
VDEPSLISAQRRFLVRHRSGLLNLLRRFDREKRGPSKYRAALKAWGASRGSGSSSRRSQRHQKNERGAYVHRRWYVRTAAKYFLQDC